LSWPASCVVCPPPVPSEPHTHAARRSPDAPSPPVGNAAAGPRSILCFDQVDRTRPIDIALSDVLGVRSFHLLLIDRRTSIRMRNLHFLVDFTGPEPSGRKNRRAPKRISNKHVKSMSNMQAPQNVRAPYNSGGIGGEGESRCLAGPVFGPARIGRIRGPSNPPRRPLQIQGEGASGGPTPHSQP
jgi:hypothetical protein